MANRNAYKKQRIINSLLFRQTNWWMAERLAELMAGLMLDPKYSDLTLECEGEEFPAHRAVVLAQSVVLEKACQAHWKEGIDNVVHIKEFDAQTVRRMIEFLYTGDYDQGKQEFVTPAENPQSSDAKANAETSDDANQPDLTEWAPADEMAADEFTGALFPQICVHAIADYYMINGLKQKAKEKTKTLLKKIPWSTKGFLAVAKEAFETTMPPATGTDSEQQQEGETLREIIVSAAFRHLIEIVRAKDFAQMDLNPELAALVLQKASEAYKTSRDTLMQEREFNLQTFQVMASRTTEFINQINRLQDQKDELEDRVKQIREVTACQDPACFFNTSIREGRQEENQLKQYETVCTNCSGALSRELVQAGNDESSPDSGDESQGDIFGNASAGPARWPQGDDDDALFAGEIFNADGGAGDDDDNVFTGVFFDMLPIP